MSAAEIVVIILGVAVGNVLAAGLGKIIADYFFNRRYNRLFPIKKKRRW